MQPRCYDVDSRLSWGQYLANLEWTAHPRISKRETTCHQHPGLISHWKGQLTDITDRSRVVPASDMLHEFISCRLDQ